MRLALYKRCCYDKLTDHCLQKFGHLPPLTFFLNFVLILMICSFTTLFHKVFPIYFVLIHYYRVEESPVCLFPLTKGHFWCLINSTETCKFYFTIPKLMRESYRLLQTKLFIHSFLFPFLFFFFTPWYFPNFSHNATLKNSVEFKFSLMVRESLTSNFYSSKAVKLTLQSGFVLFCALNNEDI